MKWPGITVDAAVLAAAIRIDAGVETDVRAVVVGDQRAGAVLEELRARQRVFLRVPIGIRFEVDFLEAVGGIAARAATWIRFMRHRHYYSALFEENQTADLCMSLLYSVKSCRALVSMEQLLPTHWYAACAIASARSRSK